MAAPAACFSRGCLALLAAGPISAPVPGPYHAFCRTLWLFAIPCTEISTTVVKQIEAMSPVVGSCVSHKYVTSKPTTLQLTELQAENITFTLSPTILTGGCRVSGQSTSLGFTSLLDDGLNYCNLHNLLAGSGLTSSPGFMEITNEWACLGLGLASCND